MDLGCRYRKGSGRAVPRSHILGVFSPDGKHVASGSYDKTVRISDVVMYSLGRQWASRSKGTSFVSTLSHSHPTASVSLQAQLMRQFGSGTWTQGKQWESRSKDTEIVTSVAFSSDGKRIGSTSYDETVRI